MKKTYSCQVIGLEISHILTVERSLILNSSINA
jgi:hypothetical protein